MNRFSERLGITPEKMVQLDDMDDELRNRLWNAIRYEWYSWSQGVRLGFYRSAWDVFFKRSIDAIKSSEHQRFGAVRKYYFACSWSEAYDLVEFTCKSASTLSKRRTSAQTESQFQVLVARVNGALESERSGYRFLDNSLVLITSPEEISEIESALISPVTVAAHIQQALELFSSRDNPNYRNAISEAISAVEAMCRLITGNNKATLGKALKELEKHNAIDVHPALNEAFQKDLWLHERR